MDEKWSTLSTLLKQLCMCLLLLSWVKGVSRHAVTVRRCSLNVEEVLQGGNTVKILNRETEICWLLICWFVDDILQILPVWSPKPLLHFLPRASPMFLDWIVSDAHAESSSTTTSQPRKVTMHIHTLDGRTRTMQSTQSPGLSQDCRQGHLPGNLSCSDYTMCLVNLWAILPFCSVKYKRHSGKGKGLRKVRSLTSLPRLNSLNQEPGFSFAQDVSLVWGHRSMRERHRKKRRRWRKKPC